MSMANGLLKGAHIFQTFYGQFQQQQQQRELKDIADQKAAESTGFTADQGKELEQLAQQGYKIDFDQGKNAYVATNDAGESKTVAMQGVTDFMGERTAGSLTPEQQDSARMSAMADVISKTDPARGMQLRRQVHQDAHQGKRMQREEKQWAKEDALQTIDQELGAELEKRMVGEDGQRRAPTADDFLGSIQQKAVRYMQAGYTKEAEQAMREHSAQAHIKIQLETAERKEALGQAVAAYQAGDAQALATFYNKYVPSGARIANVQKTKGGGLLIESVGLDGQPLASRTLDNERDALAMMMALDNPATVYQHSQNEFANMMKLRADARANRADARAAASSARADARADRAEARENAKAVALEGIAKEMDPDISPARLAAIKTGVLKLPGEGDAKFDYDPAKVQKALGETTVDRLTGRETVKRNVEAEKEFHDFMGEAGIRDTDEALVRFNQERSKANRKQKAEDAQAEQVRKQAAAQVSKLMTPENLQATAKKYNMSVEEVRQELIKKGIGKQ